MSVIESMLPLLPIGISILAITFNYDTRVRATRKRFSLILASISFVPLLFLYVDLAPLFSLPPLPLSLRLSILYLAWAALASPFYTAMCRRIFDAGLSRHFALLGLVPYLNYLFFLSLCAWPPRPVTSEAR